MSKKPYCGINTNLGKDQKVGTMKECKELNQVRLYGLYKIDKEIVKKKNKLDVEKERKKLFGIKGKKQKLNSEIEFNSIQLKRDKVSPNDKTKLLESNKLLKKEYKQLEEKEKELIKVLAVNKKSNPKTTEDEKPTKDNIQLLLVKYKARVMRINKELEEAKEKNEDNKQLLEDKKTALDKYKELVSFKKTIK
jgi:hypothetical protein